ATDLAVGRVVRAIGPALAFPGAPDIFDLLFPPRGFRFKCPVALHKTRGAGSSIGCEKTLRYAEQSLLAAQQNQSQ
ncbi:MAG: hypothetical protein COX66_02390, partial [Elusimicrobia bacterium CG_4_10_14_0_2_um_filter_63_34]